MATVLIGCDKFRGSLTAAEANRAIADGLRLAGFGGVIVERPIADGGEGTLAAFVAGTPGELRATEVAGVYGDRIEARWFRSAEGALAVIEAATVVGHDQAARHGYRPERASSAGLGDLIRLAVADGARRIVVGLGGSITTDAGAGLLEALGARYADADGRPVERPAGPALARIAAIDLSALPPALADTEIEIASDVGNPLAGPDGAAAVFGPQKGVAAGDIAAFDAGLAHFDARLAATLRRPPLGERPGAGAAGGMLIGLAAAARTTVRDGFELIAEATGLFDAVDGADLVVTGEGSLDTQSLAGKGPVALARAARARGKPTIAFAGRMVVPFADLKAAGVDAAFALADGPISLDDALARGGDLLRDRAANVFAAMRCGHALQDRRPLPL